MYWSIAWTLTGEDSEFSSTMKVLLQYPEAWLRLQHIRHQLIIWRHDEAPNVSCIDLFISLSSSHATAIECYFLTWRVVSVNIGDEE